MTLAYLACIESGNLENQALLLFRSIRKYGGRFRHAPVYAFQRRGSPPLKVDTMQTMEELCVRHRSEVDDRFPDLPLVNKIFVTSWAETHLDEEILVFCDSDTIFVGEPTAFDLDKHVSAALRPVPQRKFGSSGPGCAEDEYWRRLYELCGVTNEPFVETTITRERIRAYWNSGLIVARRSEALFAQWEDDFLRLMKAGHVPPRQGKLFIDQLALSATLARARQEVRVLDARYNYQLPKRPIMPPPDRDYQLADLIHVHYHAWFNKPGYLETLRPPLDRESETYRWVSSFLPFQPTIDKALRH